jgi:hypothetical protein
MTILSRDFSTIRALQDVEYLAQRRAFSARQSTGNEHAIEVPDGQSVGFYIQLGMVEHGHRV